MKNKTKYIGLVLVFSMLVMFVGIPVVSATTTCSKNFSKYASDGPGIVEFSGKVTYLKSSDAYGFPRYTIGYVDYSNLFAFRLTPLMFSLNVYTQVWIDDKLVWWSSDAWSNAIIINKWTSSISIQDHRVNQGPVTGYKMKVLITAWTAGYWAPRGIWLPFYGPLTSWEFNIGNYPGGGGGGDLPF